MQFRDLKSQYRALKAEMDKAIEQVLNSSDYIAGDRIDELLQQRQAPKEAPPAETQICLYSSVLDQPPDAA